jgi:F-type H+-transporting ATPase subunit epsilon
VTKNSDSFDFELISPEQKLIGAPAGLVTLPAEMGEMGIGKDHAPYLVALQAGIVALYQNPHDARPARRIFIGGGFADITAHSVSVLAEDAQDIDTIDEKTLINEITATQQNFDLAVELDDRARFANELAVLDMKLSAVHNKF